MAETYEEVSGAHTWRDPITIWRVFLLSVVAMIALFVVLTIGELCVWAAYSGVLTFNPQSAATFEQTFRTLNSALLPVFAACVAALVFLTYRTVANAHAAGAQNRLTGPILAAGAYFMPFIGLVMPPLIMGKLWHATFGDAGAKPDGLIAIWWGTLLFGTLLAITSGSAVASSADEEQRWLLISAVSLGLRAIAFTCLLITFAAIVKRQRETRPSDKHG